MKNVHDGISRPIGSKEIQKTKVETLLVDTLYKELRSYGQNKLGLHFEGIQEVYYD